MSKSTELYNVYSDSLRGNFDSSYRAKCLQAYQYEIFTVTHVQSEYHHTLDSVSKKQFLKWSANTTASFVGALVGKRMANSGIAVKGVQDINWQSIDTGPVMERYTM